MDASSSGDVDNPSKTIRPSQPRLRKVGSATLKRPFLTHLEEDTEDARKDYLDLCVPLFKYASEGNSEKAQPMLLDHEMLRSAGIAKGWTTVLLVAAGAGDVHFVKELVDLMSGSNLDLQDSKGNTALSFAAIAGNLEIVKLLCLKNNSLPKIRSGTGFTPLLFDALQGKADVANYLFPLTAIDANFDEAEWNTLFLICIESGIYGAKNSVAALKLVRLLWEGVLRGVASRSNIREIINEPSRVLFDATKGGDFDFLAELMKAYLDLIWELDERRHSTETMVYDIGNIRCCCNDLIFNFHASLLINPHITLCRV